MTNFEQINNFSELLNHDEILGESEYNYDPHSKESLGSDRNYFQRWFGKLSPSSLRSGTFTLGTMAIGLGVLSFPKAMAYFGWIGGTIMIIIMGLSSLMSYYLVAEVIGEWPQHKIFSEMIDYWLKKNWSRFTSVMFIIDYFITLVSYTTVMNSFFVETYGIWIADMIGQEVTQSYKNLVKLIFTITLTIVLYFGTLMRKAGMLGIIGISSLIMVVFLTCLCFVQIGEYRVEYEPEYLALGPGRVFDMFLNVGIFMFGFSGIACFHEVYTTIKKPTIRRMKKIALRVVIFQIIFYTAFTLAVYFSLGRLIESSAFDIYPNKPTLDSDPNNILMKIVKGIYVFVLITNYLVNSIPMKTQFLTDLKCEDNNTNNHLFAALTPISSSLLAYFYPSVNNWISIVGSVSSTAIVIVLPALCYCKAFERKVEYKTKIYFIKIWASIIVIISFFCFVATILDMNGIHPDW